MKNGLKQPILGIGKGAGGSGGKLPAVLTDRRWVGRIDQHLRARKSHQL